MVPLPMVGFVVLAVTTGVYTVHVAVSKEPVGPVGPGTVLAAPVGPVAPICPVFP